MNQPYSLYKEDFSYVSSAAGCPVDADSLSAAGCPADGSSSSAAGVPARPNRKIVGGNMSAKLSGFVAFPLGGGKSIYLRAASIDAVWIGGNRTVLQLRGCGNSDESCSTTLPLADVLSLIAAAQNG